ncbi:MAG: hypothetical protein Q9167_005191 [Letrouitia subvulpina]
MGICSSCLGLGRRQPSLEDPETTRLLSGDPYRFRYGSSIQPPPRPAFQPDPEHVRRENEALESIAHRMSELVEANSLDLQHDANIFIYVRDVVDIFTVLPDGSGEGRRINKEQSATNGLPSVAKKDQSVDRIPETKGIEESDLEGQAALYRSIKITHLDKIMCHLDERENEWSNQP